jgi:hypothetical protein
LAKFQESITESNDASKNDTANKSSTDISSALTLSGKLDLAKLTQEYMAQNPSDVNPRAAVAATAARVAANQASSPKQQDERQKYMKSLVTQTSGFSREAAQASADGQGLTSSQDVLKKILEQNATLAKMNQASIQMNQQIGEATVNNTAQLGTLNQSVGALIDDNRAKEQERWFKNRNLVLKSELAAKNFMTNFSQ